MRRLSVFSAIFVLLSTSVAFAHEFWISPEDYTIDPGQPIIAANRVGQDFKGASYAYLPQQTARFTLVQGDQEVPVTSRIGDRPALNMVPPGEGLWIVVHETQDFTLRYTDPSKFELFARHKDFPQVLARHVERGLPEKDFAERYRRFGKALVAVGAGQGDDRAVGLRTEIVAGLNPYTADLSGGMPVQVLYEGQPRAHTQVELFAKTDSGVEITHYQTDDQGRAVLPMQPGTEYLVDAVKMLEVEDDGQGGPVWESLWAALTFRTPD